MMIEHQDKNLICFNKAVIWQSIFQGNKSIAIDSHNFEANFFLGVKKFNRIILAFYNCYSFTLIVFHSEP